MKNRFKNLPLMRKVTLVVCGTALALSVILILITAAYYLSVSSEQIFKRTRAATENAADAFTVNYQDIIERFVDICGTEEFIREIRRMNTPGTSSYECESSFQNELQSLCKCNYLVSGALVLSADGSTAYSTYNNRILLPVDQIVTAEEYAQGQGVRLLSRRSNPFSTSASVIPMLIPLKTMSNSLLLIEQDGNMPEACIVLLLDWSRLERLLTLSDGGTDSITYYLVDDGGTPLSLASGAETPAFLKQEAVRPLITDAAQQSGRTIQTGDAYLTACSLCVQDTWLLGYVPRDTLQNIFGSAIVSLVLILIVSLAVILSVSYTLTGYIIAPVKRLDDIVLKIEENRYTEKETFSTQDEIGRLGTSVNRMYDTIQQQMVRIKEEESEKYRAQLKLLTEQINPHFLYNTLECIRSEVLRGRQEPAAEMIRYLAEYMRIGLSHGADFIPVSDEIRHANAYVRLMNQRFGQSVLFMYRIPPELNRCLIPKIILQPLLENSLKYGFAIDASGIPSQTPILEVNMTLADGRIHIEVADNGSGFDADRTRAIAFGQGDEAPQHVGLHNVWHRLTAAYGTDRVQMEFASFPYYRNTIEMTFPVREPE